MSGRRGIGQSSPSGKFAKNRGTPPPHKPCFFELFSLKSLGHSPAPDFFFGGVKKSCVWVCSDPQNFYEGKNALSEKIEQWTLPRRSDVHSKTLRMATCRFLTACHARSRKHVSIPLRWRCLRRLWSRIWSLSTGRLLRCLLLMSACRRNRRLVRGSARASLARQSWMPCRGSGRPRLAPASASS